MDDSDFPPELPPLRERLTDEQWRTDAALSPGHPRNYLWQVLEQAFTYYEITCREYAARTATYLEYRQDLLQEEQRLGLLHSSGSGGEGAAESVDLSEYVERLETVRQLAADCFLRAERARDNLAATYARWEFRRTESNGAPVRRPDSPRPADGQSTSLSAPEALTPDGGKPKSRPVGRGHRLKHSSRL